MSKVMNERKERLRIKLAANQQRLRRQAYLAELPERLGTYLEGRPYVQSPELDEIISVFSGYASTEGIRLYAVWDNENATYFKPESYIFREFSWFDQVLATLHAISDLHDQETAFLLRGPLYQVPFGWARKNIVEILNGSESLCVVAVDYSFGLVIDNYCGYLAEDPNPDEVVYQVAVWGFA